MAQEVFQAVQTAENKAEQLLQEAQRSARELLKATEAEITGNERDIALEHRAMYQSILDERREHVRERLAAEHPSVSALQDASLMQACGRLDQVAQRIFEGVWNDGNP